MTRYKGRHVLTLTAEHVNDPYRSLGKHWWPIRRAIGELQPQDIGKQVWETAPGTYQVENDEQRAKCTA